MGVKRNNTINYW